MTSAWTLAPDALPAYCERTGTGPWAEPLDALSNVAFLAAAAMALLAWRRSPRRDWPLLVLVADAAAIGLGSLAFHVWPGPVTFALDLWPIRLYAVVHLWLALRRLGGASRLGAGGALAALAVADRAVAWGWPRALASGAGYLPVLVALLWLGGWLALRPGAPGRRAAGRAHLVAAAVLAAALVFRSIDLPACATFPTGTHFLWHLLAGLAVALLLGSIRATPPGPDPSPVRPVA